MLPPDTTTRPFARRGDRALRTHPKDPARAAPARDTGYRRDIKAQANLQEGRHRFPTTVYMPPQLAYAALHGDGCADGQLLRIAPYAGGVFVIFGFGTKQQRLGPGETRTCPRCHNTTQWTHMRKFKQFTLFFIPVARWKRRRFESCGICGSTVEA